MADDDVKVKEETKEPEEAVATDPNSADVSGDSQKAEVSVEPDKSSGSEGETGEIMNLENMIRTNNTQIAKLSEELSEARQMLKDAFEGDTTYREHADAAKDANKIKNATRAQILKKPEVAQIATNVKVLTSELKELKEALSDYLREFNRLSGITQIEGDDGELLEIVYVAKLVKKRA